MMNFTPEQIEKIKIAQRHEMLGSAKYLKELSLKNMSELEILYFTEHFKNNNPELAKAEFTNLPDDGLINLFSLEIGDGEDFIYYRYDGREYVRATEIWERIKELDI
tara:strand:+ start:8805 stop:9125 length:321 start_codon:yes stop_codon:yes gene_type:complete